MTKGLHNQQINHVIGDSVQRRRLEHSVAKMYLLSHGLLIKDWAPASFWTAAGLAPGDFPKRLLLKWHAKPNRNKALGW